MRGGNERGKEIVGKPTMHNRYRTKLFTLCVDSAKDMIYSRLRIGAPGPGYMHLPEWTDAEYVAQLTAEKAIRKYVKGRGSVRQWIKTRERNEALDLEVYCLAALNILGPVVIRTLPERAARLATSANAAQDGSRSAEPPTRGTQGNVRVRPRGGWVNRW